MDGQTDRFNYVWMEGRKYEILKKYLDVCAILQICITAEYESTRTGNPFKTDSTHLTVSQVPFFMDCLFLSFFAEMAPSRCSSEGAIFVANFADILTSFNLEVLQAITYH